MLDPDPVLRGYALNNLAVACWWHKYPNFKDLDDQNYEEIEEEGEVASQFMNQNINRFQQIDADFENVILLLKKAIWYIENVD